MGNHRSNRSKLHGYHSNFSHRNFKNMQTMGKHMLIHENFYAGAQNEN